jgi:signal transduction histidine kinase
MILPKFLKNPIFQAVQGIRTWRAVKTGKAFPRAGAGLPPETREGKDLAVLYHEIRNCTSTLKGNAVLLKQTLQTDAERAPVERIERIAASIERIAREVMYLADPDLIAPSQAVRVDTLIQECITDYFPAAPDAFTLACPDVLPPLAGDAGKLRQAFVNLFKNSLEADASRILVRLTRKAESVSIEVEDDGIGCDPGDLHKIFLPLHSSKKETGGLGLGLALVKAIIEAHGGSIWAGLRKPGAAPVKGLIMHLTLPLPSRPTVAPAVSGTRASAMRG